MAWRRIGASHCLNQWWPSSLTHICGTRGRWVLTHWGRVTHICVGKLIIIGSDNDLSPDRRQAIIWPNAGLLSIGPLWTYFSENLIKIQQFSLKKMHVKMSSAKWRSSCLGLNVLITIWIQCIPRIIHGLYVNETTTSSRGDERTDWIVSHGKHFKQLVSYQCCGNDIKWEQFMHWGWVTHIYVCKLGHHWFR